MEWKRLTKAEAKHKTGIWNSLSKDEFDELRANWKTTIPVQLDSNYISLRKDVIEAFNKVVRSVNTAEGREKAGYAIDSKFGMELYRILRDYGFSLRQASMDEIWIYLCIAVFPDIVQNRFSGKRIKNENGETVILNVNEDRFWKTSRRIYLKTIWWYIHLSMQPGFTSEDRFNNTAEVIRDNTTDTIVQLVERSGKAGYRVDLYREIIRYYSELSGSNKADVLRKVMVLNTAMTVGIEPQLYSGGYKGYVKELFGYFGY